MKSYSSNVMINVRKILRFGFLLGSFILLSQQDVKATHIVGGDMTYRCLGGNVYEIRLTMRRDCFQGASDAQFDDPASVGIYDGTTGQLLTDLIGYPDGQLLIPFSADDTLNEILISDCSVISGDVCVHTTQYVSTIFLPYRVSGYTFAYQRCCRNFTLDNIITPLNTGMTIVADISGVAQLACNSSPQFGPYPPIYICVNHEINYDHQATDIENDSLVYTLCTPYAGGDIQHNKPQPPPEPPYDQVVWKSPYGLLNMIGGDPLRIDPHTGVITGKPNAVGQYVVGVCVVAYLRGTNLITGVTRRDYQVNVRACRDVPVANFTAPPLDCSTQTVAFVNTSLLGDNYEWFFDFGDSLGVTSTEQNPVFTYPQQGCHQVALVVSDQFGFCHDTAFQEVCAYVSQLNADFDYDVTGCVDSIQIQIHDLSIDPGGYPLGSWNWLLTYDGNVQIDTGQNPQFNLIIDDPTTVFLALVVTSSNGCTSTQTKSFPVRLIGTPELFGSHGNGEYICNGESVHLLLNGDSTLTYTWDPILGLDLTKPWDPIAYPGVTTPYSVTVTDGLCEVTGNTVVIVQQLPILAFGSTTDCLSLTAQFTNTSDNAEKYFWDFGVQELTNDTSIAISPSYTFPDTGIYTVTLVSRDGCDVSISQQVTINAISETLDDTSINCFNPTAELNPENNPGYLYSWSNGSHDPNPVVTVENDETFYVTISSPGLPGCEIVDSIRIIIPDDFFVQAGDDITNCTVLDITLTATTNGNVDLVWTDTSGVTLGAGPSLIVNPVNTTSYIVTGTDSLGCSNSDIVTIFKPDPTFFVLVTPLEDTAYCDQQIIILNASSIPGVTFEWFDSNNTSVSNESFASVTPENPTCYYVVGTDELQCQNKDSVCLTPTYFDLSILQDESICLDDEVTLSVTNNISGQHLSYLWSPGGEITSSITVHPADTTNYIVVVTNDDLGCTSSDTAEVVVNLFNPLDIVVTSDAPHDSIVLPDDIQLFVNQLDPTLIYSWTSSNGDVLPPVGNPIFVPSGPGTYTVIVENAEGCIGTASITIRVFNPPCNDEDIFLPTAFTPNNDGVNDVLLVRSNFISSFELRIYNRWGEKVFQSDDQNNGWNGQYNGEKLSPDVFGYFMRIGCPNGRSFFKKGNITLLE